MNCQRCNIVTYNNYPVILRDDPEYKIMMCPDCQDMYKEQISEILDDEEGFGIYVPEDIDDDYERKKIFLEYNHYYVLDRSVYPEKKTKKAIAAAMREVKALAKEFNAYIFEWCGKQTACEELTKNICKSNNENIHTNIKEICDVYQLIWDAEGVEYTSLSMCDRMKLLIHYIANIDKPVTNEWIKDAV